jgi:predicted MFS family arabinose efflux permease
MSLAFLSGSLVSGWLYDEIGSEKLFYVLSGLCGLALVLFFAGRWWVTSKAAKSLLQATPESE